MCCTHAQAEEVPFACHLLVDMKNYTPFPQGRARVEQELTPTPTPAPRQSRLGCRRNYISERSSSHRCEAYCFRGSWRRNGVTGGSAWLSWPDPSVASRASSVGRQHCLMPGGCSPGPGWGSPTPGDSPPRNRPGARRAETSISRATSNASTSTAGFGA